MTMSPYKTQTWNVSLKIKTYKVCVNSCTGTLLLVHDQFVKLYNYNREKLFESHATLNLANCRSAVFSQLGDKIVLGNPAGIFIINSYTYQVACIINPPQLLGRIPKNIQFISPFDMVAEINHGNSCYLVKISNNVKVKILGQIQFPKNLKSQNYQQERSNCRLVQVDIRRKVIIVVVPGYQLRFYNMQMQLTNVLTI